MNGGAHDRPPFLPHDWEAWTGPHAAHEELSHPLGSFHTWLTIFVDTVDTTCGPCSPW